MSYYYRQWPPIAILYLSAVLLFVAVVIGSHSNPSTTEPGNSGRFTPGLTISWPKGKLTLQNRIYSIGPSTKGTSGSNANYSGSAAASGTLPASVSGLQHTGIITTYFWVGEPADGDNGHITNIESTWDGNWQASYGGVDSPTGRNGYQPGGFTPKENPFYFALPYSDIDGNGQRKASGVNCPLYSVQKTSKYSWCKNSWIAIRHNGKTAYAQWEDAGPFGEDDTAYVFGSATPANTTDAKAGLDVSPAVRDYLGLGDVDTCDWAFVSSVPTGQWTNIITTDTGDNSVN